MSSSFEIGRVFYNREHRDSIAVCKLADEKYIANIMAALGNQYVVAAMTNENKELLVNIVNGHVVYKSKLINARHKDLKKGTSSSPHLDLSRLFYHHENDISTALNLLADEEMIANLITSISNPEANITFSKTDFDNIINIIVSHLVFKGIHVRAKQEELFSSENRKNFSI